MLKIALSKPQSDELAALLTYYGLSNFNTRLHSRNMNTGREIILTLDLPVGTAGTERAQRLSKNLSEALNRLAKSIENSEFGQDIKGTNS